MKVEIREAYLDDYNLNVIKGSVKSGKGEKGGYSFGNVLIKLNAPPTDNPDLQEISIEIVGNAHFCKHVKVKKTIK